MFKALTFFVFETQETYMTDELLVRAVKRGEEEAFETLVARLRMMIYHSISRHCPRSDDEYYQEALVLLYQSALQYDADKCDQFRPYYLKRLKFRLIDMLRKEQRTNKFIWMSLDAPLSDEDSARSLKDELNDPCMPTPEVLSIYNELKRDINPVTLGLSPLEYRVVTYLLNGLSLSEMAEKENRDVRVMRNAFNRLKQKVLSYLMR